MTARELHNNYAFPGAVALIAIVAVIAWFRGEPPRAFQDRIPGTDKAHLTAQPDETPVVLKGTLAQSDGKPSDIAGAWPWFRGRNLDGISDEDVKIAREWPSAGPAALWRIELGEGHAGAAVLNGRVYILDYDREQQADALRCLSLADGQEIWRFSYPVKIKRNHGMSRTVPTVTDKYVVALGPKCHVSCLDAKTGEPKWGPIDLVKEYGTVIPAWYAGQCPIIEEGKAIIAPSGDIMAVALDCETGKTLWTTPNPRGWKMSHASLIPMTFGGERFYIHCASGGVAGISATDGRLLWDTAEWKIRIATVPSPVPLADGRIFLCGGYNAGSMMMQLGKGAEGFTIQGLYRLEDKIFGSAQHTPILYKDHLYGVRPNGELICLDLEGKVKWSSGAAHRFGIGPYLIADGLIFAMDDHGLLSLAEANAVEYRQLAQAKVLDGHDSWAPMAIAGGRLLLRDLTRMVCLDVRKK